MVKAIIGIVGERDVGKSTLVSHLTRRRGFISGHPFNVGKEMLLAYYKYIGISPADAWDMLHGSTKDLPCDLLPGNVASRHFMEELGNFLGRTMGPAWTTGAELQHMSHLRNAFLVFDSVVYEADWLRENYPTTKLIRVEGPQRSNNTITAQHTSTVQAQIKVDATITNDGSKNEMYMQMDAMLREWWPDDFPVARPTAFVD